MRLVREHINEKFTEDSDPIKDLGIGLRHKIKEWLEKYEIKRYTINDDLTIDVNDTLNLSNYEHSELPNYINFNYVRGVFLAESTHLETMKGFPKKVGSFVNINYNKKLNSLKYLPKKILCNLTPADKSGYGYGLISNGFTSFKGLPSIIYGNLWIQDNHQIQTLEGFPRKITGTLFIDDKFSEKEIRKICQISENNIRFLNT